MNIVPNNEAQMNSLSMKARLGVVLSAIWAVIVFVVAIQINYGNFDQDFWAIFLIFGLLPILIGWGIRWIKQANT